MRVLVTGATGFIGRYLTQRLCENGFSVKVLARSSSDLAFLKTLDTEIILGDITDYSTVQKAMEGCQQVYHLAGRTSRLAHSHQKGLYPVNIDGTENLARAANEAGIERFVYASSSGVYGIIKHPPADETTPTLPNTAYRESKLAGERQLMAYHQSHGLPVVIARLSSVLGARCLSWLGLCQAIATGKFYLIGSGNNYLHLSHVSDTVDGLLKCGQTPGVEGNCYIIASKEPIQLCQFIRMISEEIGVQLADKTRPSLPFQLYFSTAQLLRRASGLELPRSHQYEMFLTSRILTIAKAQKELDYQPTTPIQNALKDMLQWYKASGKL